MSQVNDLVTSLTTLTGTYLGSNYSELKYKYDISNNFTNGASSKYGVIAGDVTGTTGATCFVTVDQTYEIVLTNTYKTINSDDVSKDETRIELQDISLNLYTDIIDKKAGRPDIVMNIRDLTSVLEDLDEDKLVVCRLQFTIQYRKRL